jgi:hypothetical protein
MPLIFYAVTDIQNNLLSKSSKKGQTSPLIGNTNAPSGDSLSPKGHTYPLAALLF